MRIAVVGAGYVGLVSGACFARFGHEIAFLDRDEKRIEGLRNGVVPIYEPDLDQELFNPEHKIRFHTDPEAALSEADLVLIAVGTPPRKTDGHADLTFVFQAAQEIAKHAKDGAVVVTKSTVPVGTGDEIERLMKAAAPDKQMHVASNPEFLREGSAIKDFLYPDRVVTGTSSPVARDRLAELYQSYINCGFEYIATDLRSAELIKYASNAFLAMKITYINEIAQLCEAVGSDVRTVARGMGTDRRIGEKFLEAGPGYGGSCFPKDTLALVKTAQDARSPIRLIEATTAINEQHKRMMAFKVIDACGGSVRGKRIAVLGLTFKANTDDMRESPAISIIQTLRDHGASILAYDPQGMKNASAVIDNLATSTDPYEALNGADAAVIVTEWEEFRTLDLAKVARIMRGSILVDLRNLHRADEARKVGLSLLGVGR